MSHLLTQAALAVVFLNEIQLDETICTELVILHDAIINQTGSREDLTKSTILTTVMEKTKTFMLEAACNSRTTKLWVQYFDQVTLMQEFVCAERTGNWNLHLKTICEMIPHFNAAGHLAYVKYSHLYLQQMSQLETKMTPSELERFTSKGNFTIRRSDKMWAGVWTDITLEQVLMPTMKTAGGLTHGWGLTDSALNRWVQDMLGRAELIHDFEKFCGTSFTTSEQLVELRNSHQIKG